MHVRNLGHPGPPPLPLRARPLPWESLASVLSRAAQRMGYEQPKWLLQPENSLYRLREEHLPWLCRKEDFLYLERLLWMRKRSILRRSTALLPSSRMKPTHPLTIMPASSVALSSQRGAISGLPCR
jgi:hypothetical protein